MKKKFTHVSSGQSLVEILLAIALFVLGISTVVTVYLNALTSERAASERMEAIFYADEGLDAIRSVRDVNFATLAAGTYGLAIDGGVWTLSGTSDTHDLYQRQIQISELDADTRYVTSTVTWNFTDTQSREVSFTTFFTNWQQPSGGGHGSWATPKLAAQLDLSGSADALAVAATGTTVYVGRQSSGGGEQSGEHGNSGEHGHNSNPSQDNFVIIDASSSTNPLVLGSLDIGTDVTDIGLSSDGSYAFLVTPSNSSELHVVDITNSSSPTEVASLGLQENGDPQGVYVSGTTLYIARIGNPTLAIVNVSNPLAPVEITSEYANFKGAGDVTGSLTNNDFVFLAGHGNHKEFLSVNVSNPQHPGIAGHINFSGSANGLSVAASGSVAYVGRDESSKPEFETVNVSDVSSPSSLGYYEYDGVLNSVRTGNGYVNLGGSSSTAEFLILDAVNPSSPLRYASVDLPGNSDILGLAVTPDAAYAVSSNHSSELVIIVPGP